MRSGGGLTLDANQYFSQLLGIQNVSCRNTQDSNTLTLKPSISLPIVARVLRHSVDRAVNLNREPCCWTKEVENIRPYGMLTAETKSSQAIAAQVFPE